MSTFAAFAVTLTPGRAAATSKPPTRLDSSECEPEAATSRLTAPRPPIGTSTPHRATSISTSRTTPASPSTPRPAPGACGRPTPSKRRAGPGGSCEGWSAAVDRKSKSRPVQAPLRSTSFPRRIGTGCRSSDWLWRAKSAPELRERIDERIGLRPIDADDAEEPGGQRDWLDDERDEPPAPVAHVQHLAQDGFFLAVTAVEVSRRNHRDGVTALADAPLHLLQEARVARKVTLVDGDPVPGSIERGGQLASEFAVVSAVPVADEGVVARGSHLERRCRRTCIPHGHW